MQTKFIRNVLFIYMHLEIGQLKQLMADTWFSAINFIVLHTFYKKYCMFLGDHSNYTPKTLAIKLKWNLRYFTVTISFILLWLSYKWKLKLRAIQRIKSTKNNRQKVCNIYIGGVGIRVATKFLSACSALTVIQFSSHAHTSICKI